MMILFLVMVLATPAVTAADFNWPVRTAPAPVEWSVALDRNIAWKLTLPETGQNTPVVQEGRVFFSTMKEVSADSTLGSDIVAWCVDATNGRVLWQREIPGKHPLRLSGCFGDSTSPPAVCDGNRVVFINASGTIASFDLDGKPLWQRELLSVSRTLPFVHDGRIVFTRQVYPPDPDGNFPHSYADSPLEMWTQLHALDLATGRDAWTTRCGVNMGCAILPQRLSDGRAVAVVGRGGGHGPPEKPDGISLVDLRDGATLWSLELPDFMATMCFGVRNDAVHFFHKDEHLTADARTGKITRRIPIVRDVTVRAWNDGRRVTRTLSSEEKVTARMITQTSDLLLGPWHYFRSYTHPWLGRVHVEKGTVEYLELPLQLGRASGSEDQLRWFVEPSGKKDAGLKDQALAPNDVKNSRGFVVMGDKRSAGNGWGHIAAPTPSVAGPHLYVPVMNGTVYVLRWDAPALDENAIVAINDLGPAGQSYTRASVSFAGANVFAHTIRELICIGSSR